MPTDVDKANIPAPTLIERVTVWVKSEGYPTEFRTANTFRKHGFHAQQGYYVDTEKQDAKREIDVLADATVDTGFGFLRVSYVVECKWSNEKPWIIFTSPSNRKSPSAIIAQTISSELGSAVMWVVAGNERITSLKMFSTPDRGGFGGRQSFSKGADHFYSSIQSVVGNSISYADWYNRHRVKREMPTSCVLVFPVIVVEGDLFECYFENDASDVSLTQVDHIRCHWRGSSARSFSSTVDVVALRYLDRFLAERSAEMEPLVSTLMPVFDEIGEFQRSGSREALNVTLASRGFRGVPSLLREFDSANSDDKKSD